MIRKKILLVGDFSVGKTSMIRRYVYNIFEDTYLCTIGVNISKKSLCLNDVECELLIWDIEGATSTKSIPDSYFNGASGAIFVCAVDREETIESLNEHIDHFLTVNNDAKYVIAYNKSDLLNEYQKEELHLPDNAFLTSVKDDNNIEELFMTLAKEMLV